MTKAAFFCAPKKLQGDRNRLFAFGAFYACEIFL